MYKTILLFIALSFNGLVQAQEKKTYNFSVNHLALSVKDVNRSRGILFESFEPY
jgi:hypothetical protein